MGRQLREKLEHSPLFRSFFGGTGIAIFFLFFYIRSVALAAEVIWIGECKGFEAPSCFRALAQRVFGMLAMLYFTVSLMYISYHIDVLDVHCQFNKDMAAINKAKELLQRMNEREMAGEGSSKSLL